jgi:signal transduction histidine kinase
MFPKSRSITKRLILAVLLVDLIAAVVLITAVTVHERHVQYKAFDANLRGTANVLFGAVQDAEDAGDNVLLDLRGVTLPRKAIFRVRDNQGRILGSAGTVPTEDISPGELKELTTNGHSYRFYSLTGDRIIDPGAHGGIHHQISILYGLPDDRVWHEVFEAIRFFSIASLILLSSTAMLLIWLIRRLTNPIHQLAEAAEGINVFEWKFSAPAGAREVVELQPLVLALDRALSRLHRSFQQQKRFTSDAAHELKTDLAIIKSSFQLLSMKHRTNEEYQKGVSVGLSDLARLEETVHRMLTLARLEQPASDVQSICRIDEALDQAIQQAAPAAEVKGVKLEVPLLESASVHCDSRDAILLCSNILMNAIHYTGEHTDIRIKCQVSGSQCNITVQDSGTGIDEGELPYIFEPFYRGDPSRSRTSGGTGLGLSICRAVCDRAGGTIQIANRPEGGAVVTVVLPIVGSK